MDNTENEEVGRENKQPAPPKKTGGHATRVLLIMVIIALAAALLYLMSMINHRRFFIENEKGYLVVKKGMFLPYGRENYVPEEPDLRATYAPVKLPAGTATQPREFADRAELDRELFNLLMKWTSDRVYSENQEEFELGVQYMERLSMLKASSEELRKLGSLKGDLLYKEAKKMIDETVVALRTAGKKFAESGQMGGAKFTDGDRYAKAIASAIKVLDLKAFALSPEEVDAIKRQAFVECKASLVTPPPEMLPTVTQPQGQIPAQIQVPSTVIPPPTHPDQPPSQPAVK
jgi:hypothetical protein